MAWADDLANTANRVGLTTEAVQTLRKAADYLGASVSDVDNALTKWNLNLAKARQGQGDLARILRDAGIATTDQNGKVRDGIDVFGDYVELLRATRSESERMMIVNAGMGRSATLVGQALAESNKTLPELIAYYKDLGVVIGDESVQDMAKLNAEYTLLLQRIDTLKKQSVIGFFEGWKIEIEGAARAMAALKAAAGGDFKKAASILKGEPQQPTETGNAAAPAQESVKTVGPSDSFKKALDKRVADTRTALQIERELWAAYSRERSAQNQEDAQKAQQAQEDAFAALAKSGASKTLIDYYAGLVGQLGEKPITTKMVVKLDEQSFLALDDRMEQILNGKEYDVTLKAKVQPELIWTDADTARGNVAAREAAQTGSVGEQ
jgi:hypothetical protein